MGRVPSVVASPVYAQPQEQAPVHRETYRSIPINTWISLKVSVSLSLLRSFLFPLYFDWYFHLKFFLTANVYSLLLKLFGYPVNAKTKNPKRPERGRKKWSRKRSVCHSTWHPAAASSLAGFLPDSHSVPTIWADSQSLAAQQWLELVVPTSPQKAPAHCWRGCSTGEELAFSSEGNTGQ